MKHVLIAGIGNILLGDDGVGPYVIRTLESRFSFPEGVTLEDLGTPALDFIDHIAGVDALIVVDSVENGLAAGSISLYRKDDLKQVRTSIRMDTHSPAITESLLAAEVFFGVDPKEVLLVGVTSGSFAAGCSLSLPVQDAVEGAVQAVLAELARLEVRHEVRSGAESGIWWSARQPQMM